MPPPLCWSYDKDVSVEGRRLELWVLTTAVPTFKSESWLCLGGGFWGQLVGWVGSLEKWFPFFSFLFVFLLVGFVLLCLLLHSSGSQFLLSMTAMTDP